jgi:hypothetical protein
MKHAILFPLLAMALLVVLVACGDGPVEVVAPVENRTAVQPEATVSPDAVAMAVQLLDDPFIRELMYGLRADDEPLHAAVQDASFSRTTAHVLALSRVLLLTRSGLFVRADDAEEDPDDEIHRAVLELMLDDAAALLELPPPRAEDEPQDPTQRDTTRTRSIQR